MQVKANNQIEGPTNQARSILDMMSLGDFADVDGTTQHANTKAMLVEANLRGWRVKSKVLKDTDYPMTRIWRVA